MFAGGSIAGGNFLALQRDSQQGVLGIPGAAEYSQVHQQGLLVVGLRVVVVKVIDEFFGADRRGRRERTSLEKLAHVGVRGGVDIDRKRRQRMFADRSNKRVLRFRGVLFVVRVSTTAESIVGFVAGQLNFSALQQAVFVKLLLAAFALIQSIQRLIATLQAIRDAVGSSYLAPAAGVHRFRHRLLHCLPRRRQD